MKNILIKFFIVFLLYSCSTISYDDIKHKYNGDVVNNLDLYSRLFSDYSNIKNIDTFSKESAIYFYEYDDFYYCFIKNYYLKSLNKSKLISDLELRREYSFALFNKKNKSIIFNDSMILKSRRTDLIRTKNFLYFVCIYSGNFCYNEKPKEDYITCIIISKKSRPDSLRLYKYKNQEIVLVEQKNENIRVITTKLELEFKGIASWVMGLISAKEIVWEVASRGEYIEFLYDKDLNVISERELMNPIIKK